MRKEAAAAERARRTRNRLTLRLSGWCWLREKFSCRECETITQPPGRRPCDPTGLFATSVRVLSPDRQQPL